MDQQQLQISFLIDRGSARGRLVRLGGGFDRILASYPPVVGTLLGETMALAVALAGGLKYTGVFTFQAQGSGPVSLLVADVTSGGDVRGYARFDPARVAAVTDPTIPHLLGNGYLAFTVDQGPDTDRYQGIVELTGATLAECAQGYFRQSEQIATAIMLAARGPRDEHGWRAGCLILQRMPLGAGGPMRDSDEADEAWRRAVILMASTRTEELLDPGLHGERLLYRLFHDDGLQLLDAKQLNTHCRCSRQRVVSTLKSFPRSEIEELRDEHGTVVVTCEFCKSDYSFDEDDLDRVYAS